MRVTGQGRTVSERVEAVFARRWALWLGSIALLVFWWLTVVGPWVPGTSIGWLSYHIDSDVYRLGGVYWLEDRALYEGFAGPDELPFTYPPLAAIIFVALAPWGTTAAGLIMGTIAVFSMGVVLYIVLSRLSGWNSGARRAATVWLTALSLVGVAPMMWTLSYGQINTILMALVVVDAFVVPPRYRGWLIGLAISIKLTPAVFLLYFVLRRQWRTAVTIGGSAALYTGLAALLRPAESRQYWFDTLENASRIGPLNWAGNQSITGLLYRLQLMDHAGAGRGLWLFLSAVFVALSAAVIWRLIANRHYVLALGVNALVGFFASPVSWTHHWVWCVVLILPLLLYALQLPVGAPRRWAIGVAVAGLAVFVTVPQSILPSRAGELEIQWAGWQHVVGASYLIWALVFMAVAWVYAEAWSRRAVAAGEIVAEPVRSPAAGSSPNPVGA